VLILLQNRDDLNVDFNQKYDFIVLMSFIFKILPPVKPLRIWSLKNAHNDSTNILPFFPKTQFSANGSSVYCQTLQFLLKETFSSSLLRDR